MKTRRCFKLSEEVNALLLKVYADKIISGNKMTLSDIVEECILSHLNSENLKVS